MTAVRHIRRPQARQDGPWRRIRCDCGWDGQTLGGGRSEAEIETSLELIYRSHLPEGEELTYLLVDSRAPDDADGGPIVGVFVMPIGEPVTLLASCEIDGVHHGSFRNAAGE